MINSEDLSRKVSNLAGKGTTSNSERNRRQGPTCRRGKDLEDSGTDTSPFDLVAIRAIYSLGVKSHASINSSWVAEEQRREGHHLGEERVELVD
jgi:hypothetical protein